MLSSLHNAIAPIESDWQDDASMSFAELVNQETFQKMTGAFPV